MEGFNIDIDQEINGDLREIDPLKTYYVNHRELLYSYPRLFIFNKNIIYN